MGGINSKLQSGLGSSLHSWGNCVMLGNMIKSCSALSTLLYCNTLLVLGSSRNPSKEGRRGGEGHFHV